MDSPPAGLAQRLDTKLGHLFTALILTFVAMSAFRPLMSNVDLGWHVAQGRWIVEHFAFYRADAFNYPNLGKPVIDEYPLFQVILYTAWRVGWWGPCLLTAAAYLILLGTLLRAGREFRNGALSALALGLMLLFLQVAVPLRPHLATYLGVTLLGLFLLRHRAVSDWKIFWPAALLQVAWTNCHSGFVLGPALVAVFGVEVIARRAWVERTVPWATLRTWAGAFLFLFLACLINPSGWWKFYPPFFQGSLESIRAYVSEMQPLIGPAAMLYATLAMVAFALVTLAMVTRRGAVAWSFLLFLLFFYVQALAARKAWPLFGIMLPLVILSTAAMARTSGARRPIWNLLGHFVVLVPLALALYFRLDGSSPPSLRVAWQEERAGHTELSQDATAWMHAHGLDGRIFHRNEDGGWLQQEGFFETFADTGFGKYNAAFIHQACLVGERPGLVPRYLAAWQPDFVVCGNYCYQWPVWLRRAGWRLIFYSPNSSVWTGPGNRPDLPTVSDTGVDASFDAAFPPGLLPADPLLYGRDLLYLNSLGREDFALARLRALPADVHRLAWYWEAARVICFEIPSAAAEQRHRFVDEATRLGIARLTAEFRARSLVADGREDDAFRILAALPPATLTNGEAELLLRLELERGEPGALNLARRTDCFDLRNGRHWQYLAMAESQAGHLSAAARAWTQAVFYYPDDEELLAGAEQFAALHPEAELSRALAESHSAGKK